MTNADALRKKLKELELVCSNAKPAIIAVTEVEPKRCTQPLCEADIQLEGYDLHTCINRGGRGVCIYTDENVRTTTVQPGVPYRDSLWLDIVTRDKPLRLGCIYRSPNNNPRDNAQLEAHLSHMLANTPVSKDLVILGDFNMPGVDWQTLHSYKPQTHPSSTFLKFFIDNNLTQHITKPTRYREGQRPSQPDLILTRAEDLIGNIDHHAHLGKSDHCVVTADVNIDSPQDEAVRHYRLYDRGNYDMLRETLAQKLSPEHVQELDVNEAWKYIKSHIEDAVDRCIPEVKQNGSRKKKKPLWASPHAFRKLKKKKEAFKRYLETKEGDDYRLYQRARREARKEVRRANFEYERRIALDAKRNPKRFWAHAKRRCVRKSRIPNLKRGTEELVKDTDKANEFNKVFVDNFTKENLNELPIFGTPPAGDRMENIVVNESEVLKLLRNLKVDKSMGPDNIHPRVLKEAASPLARPLTILFQKSIDSGRVPEDWKKAHICPIYKKEEKYLAKNYRPVSLTSSVSKLMETVVRDGIMGYLKDNNKINDAQYGFVQGKNTVTNLLSATDDWTAETDAGGCVDVLFLDFKKAFDSVPHVRLLGKCRELGLSDQVITWIGNFLKDRTQRVKVGEQLSTEAPVVSGVPQGSVIGPVLFIIFINDLPDGLKNKILLFADDVKLYRRVKTVADCMELQRDLNQLSAWSIKWQLLFNPTKCQLLRLGKNPPPFDYTIEHPETGMPVTIPPTSTAKDLGVTHQDNLKTDTHIREIVSKATRVSFTIVRTIEHLTQTSGKLLFCSLVRPILEYAAPIWSPHKKKDIKQIEKVQRRFTKQIPGLKTLSYSQRLSQLDLFSLRHRRRRGDLISLFQLMKENNPVVTKYLDRGGRYNTRGHNLKLKTERSRTSIRKNFFINRVRNDWNGLLQALVNAPNVDCFKRSLDLYWANDASIFEV